MSHCQHYGICGGCAVDSLTAIDKRGLVIAALTKAGYPNPQVAPLVTTPLNSRRRADLAATRHGSTIALGLHRARSAAVVDMQDCALLDPRIFALLAPLRTLLRSLESFRRAGAVIINLLDHGPDILLRLDADLTTPDRRRLIGFAQDHNARRISAAKDSAAPELVAMLQPPVITLSGIAVEPSPGAFLQASRAGEAAIIAAVIAGLPKLKPKAKLIELYAGIGTLSFALAQHARVAGFEGEAAAAAAQDKAIRAANLAGRMSIFHRDLARRPLQPTEFTGAAAVILDPPYAGAGPQMKFLRTANIPRIIYVSCNPAALATDAYQLNQSGYKLLTATPIDQFPFSENIESVIIFEK